MSSKPLPRRPAPIDQWQFRKICGRFATGVTVATLLDSEGAPHGMTVNSFSSVSLSPPLILICVGHATSVLKWFRKTDYFGINILGAQQKHLSQLFARKGHDRFEGVEWRPGATGVPLLPGVIGSLECAVERLVTLGDHDVVIGEVVHSRIREEGKPLLYFAGNYRTLGE